VIIPTVNGGGDLRLDSGATLGLFYAATMAVYGAAVTAYVNVPQVMAEDREKGVLKRVRATPLPLWLLVLGRVIGALLVAVLTLVVIAAVTAATYRPGLPSGWPVALLVLVVSALAFCVIGLAVASIARTAQSAIGMSLGTLLPLCFVSDIFVVGAKFPTWLETISWVFPLRHASRAMTDAVTPSADLWPSTGLHLLVLLAWTIAAGLLLRRTFRTEPGGQPRSAERATEPSGIRQKAVA
jgi:ABC-2 type transport system permease protein